MGSSLSANSEFYPHKMEYQRIRGEGRNEQSSLRLHDKIGIVTFLCILCFLTLLCFSSSSNRNNLKNLDVDYLGHTCGHDYSTTGSPNLKSKSYIYYANFQDYTLRDNDLVAICVSSCPEKCDTVQIDEGCQNPSEVCKYGSTEACYPTYGTYQLGKVCIPDWSEVHSLDQLTVYISVILSQIINSIKQRWYIVATSIVFTIIHGVIWLQLVHRLPRITVYSSILLFLLGSTAFMVLCWFLKAQISNHPSNLGYIYLLGNVDVQNSLLVIKSLTWIGCLLFVSNILFIIYVWCGRKELPFAAAVSKISGKRFDKLYYKFGIFSLFNLVLMPMCITYLIFSFLYDSLYDDFELFGISVSSKVTFIFQALALFLYVWCLNYFYDMFTTTVAGVFSEWYWNHREQGETPHPITRSACDVSANHMGNITIGSMFLTAVTFISGCVQLLISLLNQSTYIMSTITGATYLTSLMEALCVIMKYLEILYSFFIGFLISVVGLGFMYVPSLFIAPFYFYLMDVVNDFYLMAAILAIQFVICFSIVHVYSVGFNTFLYSFFYEKSMSYLHAEHMHCCPEDLMQFADSHPDLILEAPSPSTI